jgi:PAS domain S-box-containing protein
VGAMGLAGWIVGPSSLTTIVPGKPPMMPNTALALLLIGVAAALRHQQDGGRVRKALSLLAALAVLAIGAGTLAEYALSRDLYIDELVVRGRGAPHPGRPSPPTAFALTLLASAILLLDTRANRRARPSEWFALCAAVTALTGIIGLAFGAGPLYRLSRAPVVGMALPTTVSLLLASVGVLFERPAAGIMRVATSAGPGGVLLRRLVPAAILAPVLVGLVVIRLSAAVGIRELSIVVAIVAAAMSVVTLLLLTATAVPLNRAHAAVESSRTRTRELVEQAPDGIFVADLDGRYVEVNGAGCRLLGYARDEIIGKTIVDMIPPEDVDRLERDKARLLEGGVQVGEWMLRRKDGSYVPAEVSAKIIPDIGWQGFVRDISERRRAQDELRQAQERFELALQGADLAAWDWNIESGQVVFSPRWADMRGLRPDEVDAHVDAWISGVHPEDWPRVERALNDYFEGKSAVYETEHRVRTKSGGWLWILDRGKVFARDERGRPTRMVGTELDITARKRAEDDLRLAEASSSGILSISADAIISIDADQRITMFNEGAERIFGRAKAEAIGAPLDTLIPERLRAVHRRHVERFAAGKEGARRMGERGAPIFGLRKNGDEFPADAAISKLAVGGTTILTVTLRDISEQKRIEDEQRFLADVGPVLATTLEYEETLSRIARLAVRDLADLCVVDIVEQHGEARRVEVASRDPSQQWVCDALRQGAVAGGRPRLLRSALETKTAILLADVSQDVIASWAENDNQLRALRAAAPKSVIAVPLLARAGAVGAIALVSSTSSRRYGAADLRLAEELAYRASLSIENARLYRAAMRAIRERDDVQGIVAHDLRNPLGSILMQAALLRRRASGQDPRLQKPAEIIERAATRMNRLINDLVDVTSMEAGHLAIERDRVPTAQTLAEAIEAQRALASAASLELRPELPPDLPDVWGDRDRLLQVFENLIGNALKFTEPGGRITVGAAPRGDAVVFWVADTGAGIAAEDVPRVFDRFWQARKVGKRGAGLGLPIVKGIVEAHGGHIWVDSAPGRGSSFLFTIPTATGVSDPHAAPAPGGP